MARIDPAEVRARYGVDPAQVPDFIALRGDPSDKVPGAAGVGAVGAARLLEKYGSLERPSSARPANSAAFWRRANKKVGIGSVGCSSQLHVFDWRSEYEAAGLARDAVYLLRPDTYVALADTSGAPNTLNH
jgi:hypothetical protein